MRKYIGYLQKMQGNKVSLRESLPLLGFRSCYPLSFGRGQTREERRH